MKTVSDIFNEQKVKYDRIRQSDGRIFYYQWRPMSVCEEGVVVAIGKNYLPDIMIVSEDDTEILDFQPIPNYDENYQFVEDAAAWGKAHRIESVEGLIGLPFHQFNIEANKRCKEEN